MRFLIAAAALLAATPASAQLYDVSAVVTDGTTTTTREAFTARYREFFRTAEPMLSCINDDVALRDPFTGTRTCMPRKLYRQFRRDRTEVFRK